MGKKILINKEIRVLFSPDELNTGWDTIAQWYFQRREFLTHMHTYNRCEQRYYELYRDGMVVAGAVAYTLRIHLFTFSGISSPVKMQVIGLPVSVATEPLVGDPDEFEYLLNGILQREKGVIAGLNFTQHYINSTTLNLRTLPTIILKNGAADMHQYEASLRHPYRRRLHLVQQKFEGVRSATTSCADFTETHYGLYLQIMKKTRTKLETLSFDSFRYLPGNFLLTTFYHEELMLCWHILCMDNGTHFFYFGGMNYALRDRFDSYHNNLLGILSTAMEEGYSEVDLGQTAEIAKLRFGGEVSERKMFLYHRNSLVLGIFRLFSSMINYGFISPEHHVFKQNHITGQHNDVRA
jgi:hypothetical protein